MRIGIFGGTFDPVHIGHILIARAFINKMELDRLHIFPNSVPPLKTNGAVPEKHRLAMLRLAFESTEKAFIDCFELECGGISYTHKTIAYMREAYSGDELFLLIGSDQFSQLAKWREKVYIMKNCTICVVVRPGDDIIGEVAALNEKYSAEVRILDFPPVDISSTEFKRGLNKNLLPYKVYKYITEKGLYK